MKIINIENIPISHFNDQLIYYQPEPEVYEDGNVDNYDLNVDNIYNEDEDEDKIYNEDEDDENLVVMKYDNYIFDNFEEDCQNESCKAKSKFPRAIFNNEVTLCFICYISGYRPCMNTHLIIHLDDK